jgi:uncharacterized membrane protein (TIGR02234 family)
MTELGRRPAAGRRAAVLLTLVGAGLILLASTRTWATVNLGTGLAGLTQLTVSGRRLAPAGLPISLAAATAAIVLATSRRVVRILVATGLTLAGSALVLGAAHSAQDRAGAAAAALRDTLGLYSSGSGGTPAGSLGMQSRVTISLWPWVACLGAVMLVAAGLLGLLRGSSWPSPTRRFERAGQPVRAPGQALDTAGPAAAGDPGPASAWDALSRGEDPTSSAHPASRAEDPS